MGAAVCYFGWVANIARVPGYMHIEQPAIHCCRMRRLSTPEGRRTLLRRINKGRWRLTVDHFVHGQRHSNITEP